AQRSFSEPAACTQGRPAGGADRWTHGEAFSWRVDGSQIYLSRQLSARLLSGPERARELIARTGVVQGRDRGNTVVGPRSAQDQQARLGLWHAEQPANARLGHDGPHDVFRPLQR